MAFDFLILSIPVGLLVFAFQARKLKKPARIFLGALGLVGGVVVGFYLREPRLLSGVAWYARSPWREALFLIIMLSGMAVRSLDEAIEARSRRIAELRKKGDLETKPGLSLDPWDFSRPFLVAVPTFGALLAQIGDQGPSWSLLVLAFQNGFFWQTLLKKAP